MATKTFRGGEYFVLRAIVASCKGFESGRQWLGNDIRKISVSMQ